MPHFFFLFQIICISISLLNHFICDIFKYAVLESKTNYKIKYILLSSPLSFIIYLKNSWLSISADFHKVHCIVYYKLCEVLLFHFLTYCYKNKRKMPQSSHAMNKINPHHELAGQSGSINTGLTYIQNPFPWTSRGKKKKKNKSVSQWRGCEVFRRFISRLF